MKEKLPCSIDGCEKSHQARGWCNAHYLKFRRHGDPALGRTSDGEPKRFVEQALEKPYSKECILWTFTIGQNGYGYIWWEGKIRNVSRLVCELAYGAPPDPSYQAAHAPVICHNRACINPLHLRWSTASDNKADQKLDGTNGIKLNAEQVAAIRSDPRSHRKIAADYLVSRSMVSQIKRGEAWKDD